jgi:hypothetical protein
MSNIITVNGDEHEIEKENEKERLLNRTQYYLDNPNELKLGEKHIIILKKSGFLDTEAAKNFIEFCNDRIDIMHELKDEKDKIKIISDSLELLNTLDNFQKDVIDELKSNNLQDIIFKITFFDYDKRGSAWILDEFYDFIKYQVENENKLTIICRTMIDLTKVRKAIRILDQDLFKYFKCEFIKNPKFNSVTFTSCIFEWNKERIRELVEEENIDNITKERFDTVLVAFLLLFSKFSQRFFITKEPNKNKIKLFSCFINDCVKIPSMDKEDPKYIDLDNMWKKVLEQCAIVANEMAKRFSHRGYKETK